jgi:succinate dehydrogenase / fumarate reductase cytochrome b subunit
MDRVDRPLSPHLDVYRWQITNTLSILHRMTGVALSLGAVVFAWWLVALASGPQAYEQTYETFSATWFKLPLAGWIFCFFYHLANGVRHLVWDVGHGFEPGQIRLGGILVVAFAIVATVIYAAVAFV